jgi:succinate-acetate transporter protein
MAVGNTFGATALSSYGGFWISYAIILTPGGFEIIAAYTDGTLSSALGFYLAGWFIFTTMLLVCTLRSTVAFFLLFFTLDLAFLLLMIGSFSAEQAEALTTAGGYFGLFAAFLAWYNALAGIADDRYAQHHLLIILVKLTNSFQQFLLHRPRRALPLVRKGPRSPPQVRARDRLVCTNCV